LEGRFLELVLELEQRMAPGIKGLAIVALIEDLGRLLRDGVFSEDEIAKHLGPTELALLDGEFDPFRWYPIETYQTLTAALLRLTCGEGLAWLRARGAAAANRLLERGLYQQLDALKEGGNAWSAENYKARIRLIVTLHGALLNFSHWEVEDDPDHPGRVQIVVTEAGDYPEILRHVTEGFINACADVARGESNWRSERPEPDRIVFRMDRSFFS
jgi:hypothetical protein